VGWCPAATGVAEGGWGILAPFQAAVVCGLLAVHALDAAPTEIVH
jgi:hypothetical protein